MPFENRRLLYLGCGVLGVACLLYILANALPIWFVKFFYFGFNLLQF
jgi:hypothetical protein